MNTMAKVLAWLQIASAVAIAVSQALSALHGQGVDAGHAAAASGLAAAGFNNVVSSNKP